MRLEDVAGYAIQAGLDGERAAIAVAITVPESSSDPRKHYVTPREDSRGLWQINVKAHPEYANQNLYDPAVNAHAMAAISKNGQDFRPWTGYTTGRYLLYLPSARAAVSKVKILKPGELPPNVLAPGLGPGLGAGIANPPSGNPVVDALQPLQKLVGLISAGGHWLGDRHNIIRVLLVVGGTVMAVSGTASLTRPAVAPVLSAAKKIGVA